jgi:hypothetical protein
MLGCVVGRRLGDLEGDNDGPEEGRLVGVGDGSSVGCGVIVGLDVGGTDGVNVGTGVGRSVGVDVGSKEGDLKWKLGDCVGSNVSPVEGRGVGVGVGSILSSRAGDVVIGLGVEAIDEGNVGDNVGPSVGGLAISCVVVAFGENVGTLDGIPIGFCDGGVDEISEE